ncbi:MAG TPA: ShlB/FhaC/HecB family hemolysin secretion/activation protein [Gammaproteobacteria bacterium]|nr:ShlB/FhaC/HecB family hemolysin secretion/activation protein [Gammaproteobacteria bacterium]
MFKSLRKLILFFLISLGFNLKAYGIDIPFQIPNVSDPGQIQKNIQMETLPQKSAALPSVSNKVQPHAPIPGGEAVYFQLNKIIISGNTVFTNAELQSIFSSSIGKKISVADLQSLVQQITVRYREKGYILSRAILPPQEIKNGIVRVDVIEGFISSVTVTGKPGGAKKLLEQYGQHIVQSRPLNISVMQREILLANDLPGMTVKAIILPSKTIPDAADLMLVAEQQLISGSLDYNNYGTRFIGPIQSSLAVSANSIFVGGDATGGNFTVTSKESEMQYYNLYHTEPINSKGLNFMIGSSYIATQPQFLLEPVEIVGMSASFYGNLNYSMIRSREKNLSLHLAANYQNVTSTILAFPLYQDRIRSLALGADFDAADRWNGSNNLGIDLIQGLPIMGAHMHAEQSRPEGRARYTRLTAYFARLQPVYKSFSIYTAFSGQYSCQPLLATEQFSLGGPVFGRGYGPSEIVGDEGLAGKIELRLDMQPEKHFLQTVEYYVFYDAGVIWNRDTLNTPPRQDLTATGAGLRLMFTPELYGNLYLAKPLSRKSTTLTPLNQNPQQARGFFQLVATL